ncbi:MAG: CbtB-domain containing protein [Nitrospinae bacterium]|nr:CbtB-domain containing protein [Nitrospinota bacterium]
MNKEVSNKSVNSVLLPTLLVVGVAFLVTAVVFGADSVIPGVHDAFHDFRHSVGITCH